MGAADSKYDYRPLQSPPNSMYPAAGGEWGGVYLVGSEGRVCGWVLDGVGE